MVAPVNYSRNIDGYRVEIQANEDTPSTLLLSLIDTAGRATRVYIDPDDAMAIAAALVPWAVEQGRADRAARLHAETFV